MRKLVAEEFLTLDGVAQAPGARDEDTTGGFQHGGWHMRYIDDAFQKWVVENLTQAGGFVLGRRTYEIFASYWPNAPAEEAAVSEPLNQRPKFVASRTLPGPLEWQNSTVLKGDAAEAVAALKQENGADLHVIGSTQLVQSLIGHDLIDEFRVVFDPVIVGGGKRIFPDDGTLRPLRLGSSEVTKTGAIIATYARARD
jgi:dihydrofolate reductase